MPLLGRQHPTIRRLRELRRDPARRRAEAVFLAEGLHLAEEALRSAAALELAVYSARLTARPEGLELLARLGAAGAELIETSPDVLDRLQDAASPQPLLLVAARAAPALDAALATEDALVVVADGLQDPGNLGGLVRTADAAGAAAFVAVGDAVDPYHPRAVRATMGSIFRLPPVTAAREVLGAQLDARGFRRIGTAAAAPIAYDRQALTGRVALFFGREGIGLSPELLAQLDATVSIPMRHGVESLSVGAAAAVILFEAARQRLRRDPGGG